MRRVFIQMKNITMKTTKQLSVNERNKLDNMHIKLEQLKYKTHLAQSRYSDADDAGKSITTLNVLRKAGFDAERKMLDFDRDITKYKKALINKYK